MKQMKIPLAMIVFLCLTIPVLFSEGKKEQERVLYSRGTVEYIEGEVLIDGVEAQFGDIVTSGTVVETGPASACEIVFDTNNIFRLYENTIVTVRFTEGALDIEQGSLGAVFSRLSGVVSEGGNKFLIRSPSVVGGVRGTVFYINVLDEASSYLCTCYGKINYQDPRGGKKRYVESYHHRAFIYTYSEKRSRVRSSTLIHHDDELMEELASRIGEMISWKE